jgi:hypothetical protein
MQTLQLYMTYNSWKRPPRGPLLQRSGIMNAAEQCGLLNCSSRTEI